MFSMHLFFFSSIGFEHVKLIIHDRAEYFDVGFVAAYVRISLVNFIEQFVWCLNLCFFPSCSVDTVSHEASLVASSLMCPLISDIVFLKLVSS